MNLLVKSAGKLNQDAVLTDGTQQAFIDDSTITVISVPEGRWTLQDLVELADMARMQISEVW